MITATHCIGKCAGIPNSVRRISYGQATISPYLIGYRHCQNCDRFFKTETETHCECCNASLRISHKEISRYLKRARRHPAILTKLEDFVNHNLQLRQERERIDREMRETVEQIVKTKNELDLAIEVRENEDYLVEEQPRPAEELAVAPNNTIVLAATAPEQRENYECLIMRQ